MASGRKITFDPLNVLIKKLGASVHNIDIVEGHLEKLAFHPISSLREKFYPRR
jgi:hypothetical protein